MIAELLLEHDANVDQEDVNGATALSIAQQAGYDEIATLLLNHGANPST
jgi:ankyrin repeat protein